MRKMRALVALSFALLVTPMLMGATITLDNVTPNPAGVKGTMSGSGTYKLGPKEMLVSIEFQSYLKGKTQVVSVPGGTVGLTSSAQLSMIGAASYNPTQVILNFKDATGKLQKTQPVQNTLDQVVK